MATPNTAVQPVILTLDMPMEQALGYVASGKVPMEAYLEWDAARQKRFEAQIRSQAASQPRTPKVGHSEKGIVTVSNLPGSAFGVNGSVETFEALFALKDKIEGYIKANRDTLVALRTKHKTSPEYAATVAKLKADRKTAA